MVDPHDALVSYQQAFKNGIISPTPGALHRDLVVLMDDANGMRRITYAIVEAGVVKATVVYLALEPLEGKPCFQAGYAVALPFRGKGLATSILSKSIEEMQHGFKRHMKKFYIEAVVNVDNEASKRVAERAFPELPSEIVDSYSGERALRFLRLVINE
ncbi:GNAT family N-acetyltransferase [Massilia sp. PAMC28688]|uniref:GNAT family N-acetyltransferase n=1 Tax=Massilia sp. PAMC28688 TaxID=2861283 RepID=UPI001C62AB65|nr:GNAT family N-acetyltransferase [Massilia sp. PAMC28688]QYF93092.1 GNAT family N-acetyltransferase [Massilia sp. PAMC28688]